MSLPLLQSKLFVPPTRRNLILRPHLIAKLNSGLKHRLTLISAPAGFGKTTLVTHWLSQVERPAAWISLDEDDNDLVRFFTYAAAAVQQVKGTGRSLQGMLQSPQPAPLKALATAFINDCTTPSVPFLLALDDYHVITETAVHEAVTFLVDHLPPPLHLLITTRADPLLPLPRLRARGHLTELRTEDLRFRAQETDEFLRRVMGLTLSVEQVSALEARTEGWAAGLQMASLSIRGMTHPDQVVAFIDDFAGSHRHILDYLTDEVLAHQTAETQAFLLQTSILDRLTASLCGAVTGNENSQEVLESLESSNLFLFPLDEKREWYRYHHLFATLLQHRLSRRPKHERDTLHRLAANWFEATGLVDQAIKHHKERDDYGSVARLINLYGAATLQPGQLNRLHRWLDALPPDQVQDDAWLAGLQAWTHYFEHQTEQVATWLDHAQHALERSGALAQGRYTELWGSLVGLQSWLASQQGDFRRAIHLAEEALNILPDPAQKWRGKVYIFLGEALAGAGRTADAIGAYELALHDSGGAANWISTSAITAAIWMTFMLRGRLNEAKVQFDRMIALVTSSGQTLNASGLRMARLAILYEQNDLTAAGSELSDLRTIAQFDVGIATARYQYQLASYYTAVGEREKALRSLSQLEDSVSSWTTPDEQARAVAAIMRIYLRLGYRQNPLDWLPSVTIDPSNLTLLRITEYLAVADILRFHDSRHAQQAGLDLLQDVHTLCDDAELYGIKIEVYCLQALLLAATSNKNGALVAIRHALADAEPEGYVRTFLDFGQPMASLLKQAVSRDSHPAYARFLLTQFSQETKTQSASKFQQDTPEPLSARELEVLPLLATHLTGPEIAAQLSISINTLKTHTRNIYSKLGVSSRNEAVIAAQELGLPPITRSG